MHRVVLAAIIATTGCVDMSLATRRRFIGRATAAATAAATASATTPAFAAKTYVSGKNPDGPREKGDTKGTKKDGSYLQCLAGCAARCEKASGQGRRQLTRGECLNLCRDECCATYEQCTYTIPGV